LLLTADQSWADRFRQEAAARGLKQAESATFPSMVSLGNAVLLAEIKAVSADYPLRGSLRTSPVLNAPTPKITRTASRPSLARRKIGDHTGSRCG